MTRILAIVRSRWTPAVLVLALALAVGAKLEALRADAERGRAAEAELRRVAEDGWAAAEGLLTIQRAQQQDLEAGRRGMLQEKGLAELAAKTTGKRKRTAATIDVVSKPFEVDGLCPSTAAAGAGGASGTPSAGRGQASGDAGAPPVLKLRIRSRGWVDELEQGTLVPQLRLSVERVWPLPVEELGGDVVDVDLSKWRQAAPPAPPPEPGWIVGLGAGLGRPAYALHLVTPAWRAPLVGWRFRWWATPVLLPSAQGVEWIAVTGPAVEMGRSGR